MSLCSECFQKGDHDGHDFNMFRSQAGGACDCGDPSVLKETGWVLMKCVLLILKNCVLFYLLIVTSIQCHSI